MLLETTLYDQRLPSSLSYKTHFSRQLNCWSLRRSWSIACRRCSNYIFILGLTPGFNILRKDNCMPGRETFKVWDSVRRILETLRYVRLIYLLAGIPYIQLVNIDIDNPRCPISDNDLLDVLSGVPHQKLKNDSEVILLDGTNATCLAPFGEGRRLLWLQFVVTVPINSIEYFIVRLIVKELHCHLPGTVVMMKHPNSNSSVVKFVECGLMENPTDSLTGPMVCSFACPLKQPCGIGNKTLLTFRFERVPFSLKYNTNGQICTISLQFPS